MENIELIRNKCSKLIANGRYNLAYNLCPDDEYKPYIKQMASTDRLTRFRFKAPANFIIDYALDNCVPLVDTVNLDNYTYFDFYDGRFMVQISNEHRELLMLTDHMDIMVDREMIYCDHDYVDYIESYINQGRSFSVPFIKKYQYMCEKLHRSLKMFTFKYNDVGNNNWCGVIIRGDDYYSSENNTNIFDYYQCLHDDHVLTNIIDDSYSEIVFQELQKFKIWIKQRKKLEN